VKQYEVKFFNTVTGLLHSTFHVFAGSEEEARQEAHKQEAEASGPRVFDPPIVGAVTEIQNESVNAGPESAPEGAAESTSKE
jgi:hypothetical protein